MPSIETTVKNNSLTISGGNKFRSVKKLNVTVYSKNLPRTFSVAGASKLTCEEPVQSGALSFECIGASKIHVKNIESEKLNFQIVGASSVDIAGNAESVVAQVIGASKLQASNLDANRCDVDIIGASQAELGTIKEELSVRVGGASRFDYSGTPTIKKQEVLGASKVNSR
jgi:hypothetical protein